jgi:hypothetical protein
MGRDRLPAMVHPASSAATFTLVRTALRARSCGVCMSSVTSCVGGGLFICFTCLHVPCSTATMQALQRLCEVQGRATWT